MLKLQTPKNLTFFNFFEHPTLCRNIFTLTKPFSGLVWMATLVAIAVMPLVFFLIAKWEYTLDSKAFYWTDLSNCIWYTYITLVGGEGVTATLDTERPWAIRYPTHPYSRSKFLGTW